MIYLPSGFAPSSLLYTQDCPDFICHLLEKTEQQRESGDLGRARQYAEDARRYSLEENAHPERALALIELCDIHRESGRLGAALSHAIEAHTILNRQASPVQRHNEAVAAYNLGLIHHLLGNRVDALKWYQEGLQALQIAREYWSTHKELGWNHKCSLLERWISSLCDCLSSEEGGLYSTLIIPTWVLGDGSSRFCVVEIEIKGPPLLARRMMVDERSFQIHGLPEGEAVTLAAGKYRILRIPDDHCAQVGAEKGDWMLARCPENIQVPYYYAREEPDGLEFGYFERDLGSSTFRFVEADPHIIGGRVPDMGAASLLYPIALLKPD